MVGGRGKSRAGELWETSSKFFDVNDDEESFCCEMVLCFH